VALVTAPGGNYLTTKKVTITNVTAAAVTLTCNKVPSGGSAGAGNVVVSAMTIPANTVNGGIKEIYELENQILAPGDALQFSAGTAAALNLSVAGICQTT
jgi:hypothetical protein